MGKIEERKKRTTSAACGQNKRRLGGSGNCICLSVYGRETHMNKTTQRNVGVSEIEAIEHPLPYLGVQEYPREKESTTAKF